MSRRFALKGRHLAMTVLFFALAYALVGWLRPGLVLEAEFARLRWLAGADEHSLVAAGHRWRYVESGKGPLVVLVHGFTGAKENWLPLMRELRADFRVVAPDLPGWGESERKPGADYGPVAQAARLREFLAALPRAAGVPAKPRLLVGHSMGGQIVGFLAARSPESVGPLVLMDAAGVTFRQNEFGRAVLAGSNPFQVRNRADLDRYLGTVFTDPPPVPWPADRALVQLRTRDAEFEQAVLDRIGRGPESLQLGRELKAIRSPVLLLWCRDDRVIDASAADVFAAGLRESRTVLLDGCGHMPMMAAPAEVARVLRSAPSPQPPVR